MAKMVNPELEIVRFENEDVIAGSNDTITFNGTEWSLNGQKTTADYLDNNDYHLYNSAGQQTKASDWKDGAATWNGKNANDYYFNNNGSGN